MSEKDTYTGGSERDYRPIQTDPSYQHENDYELAGAALVELRHYINRADVPPDKSTLDPNLNRCKDHLKTLIHSLDTDSE